MHMHTLHRFGAAGGFELSLAAAIPSRRPHPNSFVPTKILCGVNDSTLPVSDRDRNRRCHLDIRRPAEVEEVEEISVGLAK